MIGFFDYVSRLLGSVAFWVVVMPWQQALRVRCGSNVRVLRAGIYLRIPILDAVHVESVRRRSSMLPTQTLSTADCHTLTLSAVVGYTIADIELLYRGLHHAEDTIVQTAQGILAREVCRRHRAAIDPEVLAEAVNVALAAAFAPYGLHEVTFQLTDIAFVRAFRLIQDQRWYHGNVLDTQGASRGTP
jgi:regulator of protease activity HflC (stomatin/prohibitin superfamily)